MTQISQILCLWHTWITVQGNVQQLMLRAMAGRRPQDNTSRHCTPVNGFGQWRGEAPIGI
ncbi:hypothetical protein [Hoylesella timonensis]|uniref:hypothetical protein n=1 Tax=Hoylesella timonensis TaxID=386414 RepID=UPI00242EAEB5|nr:hypothetical protein [Hoylesella timonensis]